MASGFVTATTTAAAAGSGAVGAVVGPDPAVAEAIERGNAVVFLDVAVGGGADGGDESSTPLGRIRLELFVKDCPRTAENFRQFCTGEHLLPNEQPAGYKVSVVCVSVCANYEW